MKHGFTLIELLAVIVILAIIALIAAPIVINIINDSKKSSQKESINMYASAVENAASNYLLRNPNDKDITLEKIEKYINYSGDKIKCNETRIYKSGKIYLSDCTVGGTKVEYTYGNKEKTLCTLVTDTGTTGLSIGDKYTCEVTKGMEEPYTFYVLTEPQDGKVNLIMNSNICNDGTLPTVNNSCKYAWHWKNQNGDEANNRYGPDTAMTNLYNGTKNWTNVPDMMMNYEDENNDYDEIGYETITTDESTKITTILGKQNKISQYQTFGNVEQPLKARLPKLKEVTDAGCHIYNSSTYGTCPYWLVENLYYDMSVFITLCTTCLTKYEGNISNGITDILGYWLLSSDSNSTAAKHVGYNGSVRSYNTSSAGNNGVRPVITVSLFDLS